MPIIFDMDGNELNEQESTLRCQEIDQGIDSFCNITCFCCYNFLDPIKTKL